MMNQNTVAKTEYTIMLKPPSKRARVWVVPIEAWKRIGEK
jgi:hypothetical protein